MATLVETPDTKILIDPGCALGPRRGDAKKFYYPHPLEYKALKECTEKIVAASKEAEILIISHYHYDHHKPQFTDYFTIHSNKEIAQKIYSNKIIYAKDFHDNINASQRKRGFLFNKIMKKYFKEIHFVDAKTLQRGNTEVKFSPPVYHGEEKAKGGWVIMCSIIYDDEKFLFTSDVQGPMNKDALDIILNQKPDVAYIGGPPTYLRNLLSDNVLNQALNNMTQLAEKIPSLIIDHHLLRDKNWRKWADTIFDIGLEKKHKMYCASEYINKPENILEAIRETLYKNHPPNEKFMKWLNLPEKKRTKIIPPIN
ncbi:MAG: hypothetical protein HWN67_07260 [Candidatus Helarchaeota archaeon]|nr:hypothetical protein [Candidatus Helarchaeota archaeon]